MLTDPAIANFPPQRVGRSMLGAAGNQTDDLGNGNFVIHAIHLTSISGEGRLVERGN